MDRHRRTTGLIPTALQLRRAPAWAATLAVVGGAGALVVRNTTAALVIALAVLAIGLLATDLVLIAVVALPGSLLLQRVGGRGINLSMADFLVFAASVVALGQVDWQKAGWLRAFLKSFLVYEAVLLVVIAYHPNRYDIVEWFHRLADVGGSVVIGWVIAAHGRLKQAVRLYLYATSVIAVLAMEHSIKMHFAPGQWGLYQKNAIGAMLWVAIVLAQLSPPWIGLGRAQVRIPQVLCFGGLVASQSRQSILVLIGAIGLAYLMRSDVRSRSKLIFVALLPLAVISYYSFKTQFVVNPQFNTVAIRVDQLSRALKVWHLSPWLGEGMRFYNLPQFSTVPTPPNVIIGGLASTGIVGVVAFLYFAATSTAVMARLPRAFGIVGLVVLTGHFVEGLFDIFWIGAYSAIPFIIVGASLGMCDTAVDPDMARHPVMATIEDE